MSAGKLLTKPPDRPSNLFQVVRRVENATCAIHVAFGESHFNEPPDGPSKNFLRVIMWRMQRVLPLKLSVKTTLTSHRMALQNYFEWRVTGCFMRSKT